MRCRSGHDVAKAITTMVIRGAPAIGVAAAMGLALGAQRSKATGTRQFVTEFQRLADVLAATRPTAVNLFWAIERMKQAFAAGAQAGESVARADRTAPPRGRPHPRRGRRQLPGDRPATAPRCCPTTRGC